MADVEAGKTADTEELVEVKKSKSMQEQLAKYIIEFFGTMCLVLTVGLAAKSGAALTPLAIGSLLSLIIYMGGYVSGGAYNPAVSLALAIRGAIPWLDFAVYFLVEILGGLLGALLASAIGDSGTNFVPAFPVARDVGQAFGAEFLYTFALCFTVLSTATAKENTGNSFYGLCIGWTVMVAAVVIGPISGAVLNPAVGTGLIAVAAAWDANGLEAGDIWIYWVAPLLGGAVAAGAFFVTNPKELQTPAQAAAGDPPTLKFAGPIMEFIGTFFLVLTVTLSSAANSTLGALAIASILMIFIFGGGHVSGGQYNPAVSLGVLIRGGQPPLQAIIFMLVQCVAALVAAAVGYGLLPATNTEKYLVYPHVGTNYDAGQAFIGELLYTMILVSAVLFTATTPSQAGNSHFGFAIGMTVLAGAISVGRVTGGGFNPAVAFGTNIIATAVEAVNIADIWLYLVAPMIGGALAGLLYRVTNPGEFKKA